VIVPSSIAAGVVVLILFAFWEARVERSGGTPIVSIALFRNTNFVAGASVIGTLMLAQNGVIFSLPVFLQSVLMLDAFHTGLSFLPMSIALLVVSPAAGFLTKRVPHKRLVQTGLIVSVIALFVLWASLSADMNPAMLIPGLALYGVGMGMVLSQINNLTLSSVSVRDAGEASGVANTFRQVGSSLGAAIIGAILLHAIIANLGGHAPRDVASIAFGAPVSDPKIVEVRREATTRGIREAMLVGAAFAFLGLIVSNWLPMRAATHAEE